MSYIKGNVVVLVVMLLVITIASLFVWTLMQKNRANNAEDSAALGALKTVEGQSPYTDLEGNHVVLSDYIGEVLVVTSWASWCPACAVDLPRLSNLAKSYEGKGVRILAINRSEPAMTAQSFLNTVGATEGALLVLDPDDRFYESIGGYTMPETLFYDSNGNVIHHARGTIGINEMQKYIDAALLKVSSDSR